MITVYEVEYKKNFRLDKDDPIPRLKCQTFPSHLNSLSMPLIADLEVRSARVLEAEVKAGWRKSFTKSFPVG